MVSAVNIAMMNLEEFLPDSVINEMYEKKKMNNIESIYKMYSFSYF